MSSAAQSVVPRATYVPTQDDELLEPSWRCIVNNRPPNAERQIALVEERLQLIEMLNKLQPLYFGSAHTRETPDGGWTHPWKKVDALRNYLILTCFDTLGQRLGYLDFQSWLRARRTAPEREAAIASLLAETAPPEVAAVLHKQYLAQHGATQAFYRFFREILNADARAELLFSVRIREIDIAKNTELRTLDDPRLKEDFLFEVRNKFTHEARDTGSPGGGVFPGWGKPILIDGEPRMGWEPIHHVDKGNTRTEYGVRDWPNALIKAVRSGISTLRGALGGRCGSR